MQSILSGDAITNETLAAMSKYTGKETGQKERAQHALDTMNEDKKYKALEFVNELKKEYGTGASTLCLFYNATGDAINFIEKHDWYGHSYKYPYPPELGNGQWGAFLHVHQGGSATGAIGAIVYRGKNCDGNDTDWMQAWYNPWAGTNRAYTEVHEAGYFTEGVWDGIYDKLSNTSANNDYQGNGGQSGVGIGNDTSPYFDGVMTLEGLVIPKSK
ncbi:23 kDa jasmonate-induced protein [Ziziphus jujuba]|uniref:23 kDa jasmonate-induced protein n=1 Tax=Ziziphus jujuba TaxID=326968 RepID=A0ABM3IRZ4_ZIZJJ|nr:23 kDa jasmonate-induced protein [Ziziphus jujuba]